MKKKGSLNIKKLNFSMHPRSISNEFVPLSIYFLFTSTILHIWIHSVFLSKYLSILPYLASASILHGHFQITFISKNRNMGQFDPNITVFFDVQYRLMNNKSILTTVLFPHTFNKIIEHNS